MLWLDQKYLKQVSHRLEGYKEVNLNPFTANFRCPICGDSVKNARKKRGYMIARGNSLWFKCFNHMPDQSLHFGNFLKEYDHALYDEYAFERYQNDTMKFKPREPLEPDFRVKIEGRLAVADQNRSFFTGTTCVESLPKGHPALNYVIRRKIPEQHWNLLYYVPKFIEWAKTNCDRFEKFTPETDHPRLIIPWFSKEGRVFAYQARAFGAEEPKYYSITLDDMEDRFYGLERVDYTKRVYVVEGPLDSLFLPNSIAVGSSGLHSFQNPIADIVYVWDVEPRNKEVCKIIGKGVKAGLKVFLAPPTYKYKDINEAVEDGMDPRHIVELINHNVYNGLEAELKFADWRKC